MAGRDVSRTELDLRASDAVVAVREAFELVTTVHEFLNLQHADAAGGDPLTVPTTNEDGTPAAGKFGYTADEAYLLRLVFDQLSSLAVQPILETGRQLTGLK